MDDREGKKGKKADSKCGNFSSKAVEPSSKMCLLFTVTFGGSSVFSKFTVNGKKSFKKHFLFF